jgi:hypothetical protein
VKVTSSASPGGIEGVTVSAVTAVSAPGAAEVVTTAAGEAGFTLAPGEWTFSVTGAESTGHLDVGPDEASDAAPRTFTVEVGDSGATVNVGLTLQPFDATVSGTVLLVTGDDSASVSAFTDAVTTVTATSGSISRSVTTADGNFSIGVTSDRPWAISASGVGIVGSTTLSATYASGVTTGADITVSASVRSISGTVTGAAGQVTITASANGFAPISQTVNGSGPFSFDGLNATVTWTITFSDGTVTVTRFVAPGANVTDLNQDLAAAAAASIVVNLTDTAEDGLRTTDLVVTVTLSDPQAFPRIPAPIVETLTLSAGTTTAAVTFPNLVTTSGSPPFTIVVSADGYVAHSLNDASPGTPIDVNLVPSTRTVVLSLEKNTATVIPDSAELTRTVEGITSTLSATIAGNVATFTGVTPGTWDLVVPDYSSPSVVVPIGSGEYSETVQLLGVATSIAFYFGTDATTSVSVVSGSAATAIQVRLLDAQDAVLQVTVSATLSLASSDIGTISVVPAAGDVTIVDGLLSLEITGEVAGTVNLTIAVGQISAILAVTITEPEVP